MNTSNVQIYKRLFAVVYLPLNKGTLKMAAVVGGRRLEGAGES